MSKKVKRLIKTADTEDIVFGLRNQVVIEYQSGQDRTLERTVEFIHEHDGKVVGHVHIAGQKGKMKRMDVEWNPKRKAWVETY